MAALKTRKTDANVAAFLDAIEDDARRADCMAVMQLMSEVTGEEPAMWGTSMVGFGHYHYVYASGREGDWFLTGFAPRKQALTLYMMGCLDGHEDALARLGKYKNGKACIYVKRLSDIDLEVLRELVQVAVADLKARYPVSSTGRIESGTQARAGEKTGAPKRKTKKKKAKKTTSAARTKKTTSAARTKKKAASRERRGGGAKKTAARRRA